MDNTKLVLRECLQKLNELDVYLIETIEMERDSTDDFERGLDNGQLKGSLSTARELFEVIDSTVQKLMQNREKLRSWIINYFDHL